MWFHVFCFGLICVYFEFSVQMSLCFGFCLFTISYFIVFYFICISIFRAQYRVVLFQSSNSLLPDFPFLFFIPYLLYEREREKIEKKKISNNFIIIKIYCVLIFLGY